MLLRNVIFTGTHQQNCAHKLGRHTPALITKRGIILYNSLPHEVIQCKEIFGLSDAIKISAAKRKCSEVFVDRLQQRFGRGESMYLFGIRSLSVVV